MLLPEMVKVARANFRSDVEVQVAVLGAWISLAGMKAWTPAMVRQVQVEQEMQR